MTLNQIRYVVEIARARSFSKAAARLYVSQSTLSSAIRQLEDELGIAVFSRGVGGAELTAEGKRVFQHAMNMLNEQDALLAVGRRTVQNRLTVDCYPIIFCGNAIVRLVEQVQNRETLDMIFNEDHTWKSVDRVASGQSDLAVISEVLYDGQSVKKWRPAHGLTYIMLGELPLQVRLHKEHPLLRRYTPGEPFDETLLGDCLYTHVGFSGDENLEYAYTFESNRADAPRKQITVYNTYINSKVYPMSRTIFEFQFQKPDNLWYNTIALPSGRTGQR